MDIENAALGFAAVGSTQRLKVLMTLVRAGNDGLSVGDVQNRLCIPASTLAHHLKTLTDAGLITQEKSGRSVINFAHFDALKHLGEFLLLECCEDDAAIPDLEAINE